MPEESKKETEKAAKSLMEWLEEVAKDIEPLKEKELPYLCYNEEGDILHVVTHIDHVNGHYWGRWINHTLTVMRADDKDGKPHVVGFELWDFKSLSPHMLEWSVDYLAESGCSIPVSLIKKIEEMQKEVRSSKDEG